MKEACVRKSKLSADAVEVLQPEIRADDVVLCKNREEVETRLFYPATPLKYKNHMFVLRALKKMKDKGTLGALKLDLTLNGTENELSQSLLRYVQEFQLPVCFCGILPRQEVMERYASSTLIFPSYIETFGLPLLEARKSDTCVIASDCSFSREILEGYDAAWFFDPFDENQLIDILEKFTKNNG